MLLTDPDATPYIVQPIALLSARTELFFDIEAMFDPTVDIDLYGDVVHGHDRGVGPRISVFWRLYSFSEDRAPFL